jgi:antibiotic biosynthesis monooxygenase (ABM) superfamily enzyme
VYIHAFVFRWKQKVDGAQIRRIKSEILKFQGQIPGLLETHVGLNAAGNRKEYEFGGIMKFADKAALDAYQTHPMHLQLLEWLVPLIDPIELDFEA